MRTIRLTDPFPRGKPAQRLEWGSSAWAADSCLVEWSTLEREWLEPRPAARPCRRAWRWHTPAFSPRAWLGLAAFATALALLAFV